MKPAPDKLFIATASTADAAALASLHRHVNDDLAQRYGGPASPGPGERTLLYELARPKFVQILIARNANDIVGTLRLATKKPWAIDAAYYSATQRPLYLTDMAVIPSLQRSGIGRRLLQQAEAAARSWPGDSIRLDALDAAAGAGPFYAKCGYREVGRVTYRKTPLIYFELVL